MSRKIPWKLSPTRKANARARLKKVDAVIESVRLSGVRCAALVRRIFAITLDVFVQLLLHRTELWNCQRSTKCPQKTSILSSAHAPKDIEREYTRFQSGQGCALFVLF